MIKSESEGLINQSKDFTNKNNRSWQKINNNSRVPLHQNNHPSSSGIGLENGDRSAVLGEEQSPTS